MAATTIKRSVADSQSERVRLLLDQLKADPEMWEVCGKHNVGPALRVAAELAMEVFSPIAAAQVELDVDPDTGEPRFVLDITVDSSSDEAFSQYSTYTRRWVAALPPEARERVRLIFHTLRDQ
jgi:hypothetical protein